MFLIGSRTAEEKTMLNANTKMQLIIGGTAKKKKNGPNKGKVLSRLDSY